MKTQTNKKSSLSGLLTIAFFPLSILYGECLLRLFDKSCTLFGRSLWIVMLFSLGAGLLLSAVFALIQNKKVRNIFAIVLLSAATILLCVQFCCKNYFKT